MCVEAKPIVDIRMNHACIGRVESSRQEQEEEEREEMMTISHRYRRVDKYDCE